MSGVLRKTSSWVQRTQVFRFWFLACLFWAVSFAQDDSHVNVIAMGHEVTNGTPYPYSQTIRSGSESFEVELNAKLENDPGADLYVSTFGGNIGIMKHPDASSASVVDYRHINSDEVLALSFRQVPTEKTVSLHRVSGNGAQFSSGTELIFTLNGEEVRRIECDGRADYDILPPLLVSNEDTVTFTPTQSVRLEAIHVQLELDLNSTEPFIPNSSQTETLLQHAVTEEGRYFLTADWSGVSQKPNGVLARLTDTQSVQFRRRGQRGPDVAAVDVDLGVLQPGDVVDVLAGLTGDAGEDSSLWDVTLTRYESWTSSRYTPAQIPWALASPVDGLSLQQDAWPKHTSFRADSDGQSDYTRFWNRINESLGHATKCYGEERAASPPNLAHMQRYAEENPSRMALLHWNGYSIKIANPDLPSGADGFRPYHFVYEAGSYLSAPITAASTTIEVMDAGPFGTQSRNLALILPVDPQTGKRDLEMGELVLITAISGNTLTVERNKFAAEFGGQARDFAAGAYIAPNVRDYFVDRPEDTLFTYNYALNAPQDSLGRNGGDVLVDVLASSFAAGDDLERFHGIMFDIVRDFARTELVDSDLDGVVDGGLDERGIDLVQLGSYGFAEKVRQALPGRIITFDGNGKTWPRWHRLFNGIESEGFAHHNDSYVKDWASALNWYQFTTRWNSSDLVLNFCVPKFGDLEEERRPFDLMNNAAGTILGLTMNHRPAVDPDATYRVDDNHAFDEFRRGEDHVLQWLGAPVGPVLRPALNTPDLLLGSELPAAEWTSPDNSATIVDDPDGIRIFGDPEIRSSRTQMTVSYSGIPIPEGDLVIRFEVRGSGFSHLPSTAPRYLTATVDGRQASEWNYDEQQAIFTSDGFTENVLFYRGAGAPGGSTVDLSFAIEGTNDVWIQNITFHQATDVILRRFEHGVVLANPSERPYTFDLADAFPGVSFTRIWGQSYDDPVTNDGSVVGDTVELGGHRGLFLRITDSVPTASAVVLEPDNPVVGTPVILSAAGSSFPGGGALTYGWSQLEGPNVILDLTNPIQPTFVPSEVGQYRFRVSVQDGTSGPVEAEVAFWVDSDTTLQNVLTGRYIRSVTGEWDPVEHVNDGAVGTRWTNLGMPAEIEFDLEQSYRVSMLEMLPYDGRDYQFNLEMKENESDDYVMVLDARGSTEGGTLISKSFPEATGRFVRLTVTGAATYTGNFVSLYEVRLLTPDPVVPPMVMQAAQVFSDGVILQREKKVTLWGEAPSGVEARVFFEDQQKYTFSQDGIWKVQLDELDANEVGQQLRIEFYQQGVKIREQVISDVLVGEVVLAGGQSNMVHLMRNDINGDIDRQAIQEPMIRFYLVERTLDPNHIGNESWKKANNPDVIGAWSAVAFYYAQDLQQQLGVPVGVVQCASGSSRMEAWMTEESLDAEPELVWLADRYRTNPDFWMEDSVEGKKWPVLLYNAMFKKIRHYTVRNVIWYQGESNAREEYQEIFVTMLTALKSLWRSDLGDPDLPFYLVQLSSYDSRDDWTRVRENQLLTYMQDYERSGLAVTMDVGDPDNIHPQNKKPVGERLARIARYKLYGETSLIFSGPIFRSADPAGSELRLNFYFDEGLSVQNGGSLQEFEVAGSDLVYHPAQAEIYGSQVRVWSAVVADPQYVRYLWKNTGMPTLYNAGNLPASPFRTDNVTYPSLLQVPPDAPTGLVPFIGDGSVGLRWNAHPDPDVTAYAIYRETASSPGFQQIDTVQSITEYRDLSVQNESTYHYRVTALTGSGLESTPSPAVIAIPRPLTLERFEAEEALIQGAQIKQTFNGYSGSGYVDYANATGDYIEWIVYVSDSDAVVLFFGYALQSGDRPLEIRVNDQVVDGSLPFPGTGGWGTYGRTSGLAVSLQLGWNTVRATAIGSSGGNLDYLYIVGEGDRDGDGLTDTWEYIHFGSLSSQDGSVDSDGDGASDLHEFRAGTDPTDPLSVFAIHSVLPGSANGSWDLTFGGNPGVTYTLYTTDNLQEDDWVPAVENLQGSSTYTIPIALPSETLFIKVMQEQYAEPTD